MSAAPTSVVIRYNADHTGSFLVPENALDKPIWTRLKLAIRTKKYDHKLTDGVISVSWPNTLDVVRELGSKANQKNLQFRFRPEGKAADKLRMFAAQVHKVHEQRNKLGALLTGDEIGSRLKTLGFAKRQLRDFQLRDLSHLLALGNGANFSVPGAGKTTVTFALHMLTRKTGQHLIVVSPRSAFSAWMEIVEECMSDDAPEDGNEPFTLLEGTDDEIQKILSSASARFVISYDMAIRRQEILSFHLASTPTHLVLDESHRMKAGWNSQRGSFFLRNATAPVRRDILSGTPMPHSVSDIVSQLDFLWPGHGYGLEISRGKSARDVLGNLYVRTTKQELGLPPVQRNYIDVDMDPGQLALYSIVRNEFVRNYSKQISQGMKSEQILRARQSVMRLLQLSINPTLALTAMGKNNYEMDSAIADQVFEEGYSAKMRAIMDHIYELARDGKKCVLWTIFTDTIHSFVSALADLNPVFIHGEVQSGMPSDHDSREGRIRRFHEDSGCHLLVANPATAGEGISLHTVCHDAIYADRSYVSTHYLQSVDRIHRLGLGPDEETNIYIYRSKAPPQVGSIDMSVGRRLGEKIRNMQIVLNDADLDVIALDEEGAEDPLDYSIDLGDILDIINELEGKAPQMPLEMES